MRRKQKKIGIADIFVYGRHWHTESVIFTIKRTAPWSKVINGDTHWLCGFKALSLGHNDATLPDLFCFCQHQIQITKQDIRTHMDKLCSQVHHTFLCLQNVAAPLGMVGRKIAINCKIDMFYRVAKLESGCYEYFIYSIKKCYYKIEW